jgi:hypothetical protein
MPKRASHASALIVKLHRLPPEKVAEVEDFVDFLAQRDEQGV